MRMRIRSIYTKLLLGFFALLLVEAGLMILWSQLFVDNVLMDEDLRDADVQGKLLRMTLREAAATAPDVAPADNQRLVATINEFSGYYGAEVWLVDGQGIVVYSTTGAGLPAVDTKGTRVLDNLTLAQVRSNGWWEPPVYYATVPADMGKWGRMTLHVRAGDYHDSALFAQYFLLGQLLVGLVIVLVIFPVSRFFTTPIRRLKAAVLQYADGDLKSRVRQARGDEIGELGRAFNLMADNLEAMILGSRELVANVSHELRSPLARIRISEEMLRNWGDKAGLVVHRRHLDNIREEIEHLDGLIGRMLEITRLNVRESETRPERVDLSALARRMAARYQDVGEHHHVRFDVDVAEGVAVLGNAESLASVLTNLLDNAFKYCPGQGRVLLGLDRDEQGLVRLRVENTHAPLTPEELEMIFRPFRRVGTKGQKGYGLGLFIVRKIAERHHGRVQAANIRDGLRFEVTLPSVP